MLYSMSTCSAARPVSVNRRPVKNPSSESARKKKHGKIVFCIIRLEIVVDLHVMHFKDVLQTAICTTKMDYSRWS
jgi:hypothetical protein